MLVISLISSFLFFSWFGGSGILNSYEFLESLIYIKPNLGKQFSYPILSSLMHLTYILIELFYGFFVLIYEKWVSFIINSLINF